MKKYIYSIFTICFLFSLCSFALGQRKKSILLPASEAKTITRQCSRPSPTDFSGTWQPTKADIKLMESKFSAITKLKANCCIEGFQVKNLKSWFMQYVGIVINDKKLIYINSFMKVDSLNWKKQAYLVCDGGSNYWGVLYDPKTEEFFDLSVNGKA